jgi:hypothetical protein
MDAEQAIKYLQEKVDRREPVFILRGQDQCAVQTILHWIKEAQAENVNIDKLNGAYDVAQQFQKWPIKKVPD